MSMTRSYTFLPTLATYNQREDPPTNCLWVLEVQCSSVTPPHSSFSDATSYPYHQDIVYINEHRNLPYSTHRFHSPKSIHVYKYKNIMIVSLMQLCITNGTRLTEYASKFTIALSLYRIAS